MKTWIHSKVSSSLLILILSMITLSYMVYRSDVNERNSTLRDSGFMILTRLNHLQLLIDEVHYGSAERDVEIKGWSDVLLIKDLTVFFPDEDQDGSTALQKSWQQNFEHLHTQPANQELTKAIEVMRTQIKNRIDRL